MMRTEDGIELLTSTDNITYDGIALADDEGIGVTEGITERNTIGDDDRSIDFIFNGLALGGLCDIELVSLKSIT